MTSFRFKLGILLAIIAGALVVSQVVYRNTITAMHDAVFLLPSGEPANKITANFGIASFPDDGIGKFKALLKKADERLYLAKSSGRNRVVC